jgi:hypothetical protein
MEFYFIWFILHGLIALVDDLDHGLIARTGQDLEGPEFHVALHRGQKLPRSPDGNARISWTPLQNACSFGARHPPAHS